MGSATRIVIVNVSPSLVSVDCVISKKPDLFSLPALVGVPGVLISPTGSVTLTDWAANAMPLPDKTANVAPSAIVADILFIFPPNV
jgi:hypothetical protein